MDRPQPPLGQDGLWVYLFGDPRNPNDVGVIGRLETEIHELSQSVKGLQKVGWAFVMALFVAALGLIANLIRH